MSSGFGRRVWISFIALAVSGVAAYGESIGGPNSSCGTCQGSIYTLTYDPTKTTQSKGGGEYVYQITLTIDATKYAGGGLYLDQVAIKVANSEVSGDSKLYSAPGGVTSIWTLEAGGINGKECSGAGNGFLCAQDGPNLPPLIKTGASSYTYTWVFDYATTQSLLTGSDQATIKARYVDGSGNKVGALVSESITLTPFTPKSSVPEPASIALLGSVLAGLVVLQRKRFRAGS